jgi:hypothetical protein
MCRNARPDPRLKVRRLLDGRLDTLVRELLDRLVRRHHVQPRVAELIDLPHAPPDAHPRRAYLRALLPHGHRRVRHFVGVPLDLKREVVEPQRPDARLRHQLGVLQHRPPRHCLLLLARTPLVVERRREVEPVVGTTLRR